MKTNLHSPLWLLSCLCLFLSVPVLADNEGVMESPMQRLIILTDIENEPDDSESIVRLLMYSDKLDIKGIIASTSTHMRNRVAPESINEIIDAYSKVYSNLLLHSKGFTSPESLYSMVKSGLPRYGMNGVGKGKDSEGSEWILSELKKDDPRPLWVCAWGGSSVLAQTLWKIKDSMSKQETEKLVSKLRVYTISDQDDTGAWLRKTFPNLFYIVSTGGYGGATWLGISTFSKHSDTEVISDAWLAENIQQGHGPLGLCYPDVAYSMEGDTPSFLGLIQNGLNNMEHPNWGGWGGRYELYVPEYHEGRPGPFGVPYEKETRPIWTNADDTILEYCSGIGPRPVRDTVRYSGNQETIWRWRTEYQNDFAARMDWCTKPYAEANHNPEATVKMYTRVHDRAEDTPSREEIKDFTVKSGQPFWLDVSAKDPDGDSVSYFWFNYPEAGTVDKFIRVEDTPIMHMARLTAPVVQKTEYLHFILKVTDKGTPRLTTYKRIIVKVVPN